MKKKRNQNFWTKQYTDSACIRYHKWSHKPTIQQKIFNDHIVKPLRNVTYSILWEQLTFKTESKTHPTGKKVRYLWEIISEDKRGLDIIVDDVVGFFFVSALPKWKTKETQPKKGFSYVYRCVKNYLIKKGKGSDKRKRNLTIDDVDLTFYRQTLKNEPLLLQRTTDSDLRNDEVDYMNLVINYWERNISEIWRSELKKEIASSIVEVFRRADTIKYHKQKSIYRYIRVMMGWDKDPKSLEGTNEKRAFKDVMKTFRKKNELFRIQYRNCGMIDFFHS